jgi:hypothetical protein
MYQLLPTIVGEPHNFEQYDDAARWPEPMPWHRIEE